MKCNLLNWSYNLSLISYLKDISKYICEYLIHNFVISHLHGILIIYPT